MPILYAQQLTTLQLNSSLGFPQNTIPYEAFLFLFFPISNNSIGFSSLIRQSPFKHIPFHTHAIKSITFLKVDAISLSDKIKNPSVCF